MTHSAELVVEKLDDLIRLMQWQIVHDSHVQRWSTRNPGMWWCSECGSPAPTDFDPYAARTDGEVGG